MINTNTMKVLSREYQPLASIIGLTAGLILFLFAFTQVHSTANNNLDVSTATFFGSGSDDTLLATDIGPDKSLYVAGQVGSDQNFGVTPIGLTGGATTGIVAKVTTNGQSVQNVARLGSVVDDVAVTSNGSVAVVGDFGVALLSQNLDTLLWSDSIGSGGADSNNGRRVSIGNDNSIVTLGGKEVKVYSTGGDVLQSFTVSGTYVDDIAVDGQSQTIAVTGFSQKDGGSCTQLQVAFVRGYTYNGTQKWSGYDWTHAQAHGQDSSCADTRGRRVDIGEDGQLYFTGETAGGNTIYRYSPKVLSTNANNIATDQFNNPFNTASNHITYYARLSPSTGDIDRGQFNLTRLSSGKGNTIKPLGITADASGRVLVVGQANASIVNRNDQTINGTPIGAYSGLDNFVLQTSQDFGTREMMTTFTNGCRARFTEVVSKQGVSVAVGHSTESGCGMITVSAIQGSSPGGTDGFLAVWGDVTPGQPTASEPITNEPAPESTPNQQQDQGSSNSEVQNPQNSQPQGVDIPPASSTGSNQRSQGSFINPSAEPSPSTSGSQSPSESEDITEQDSEDFERESSNQNRFNEDSSDEMMEGVTQDQELDEQEIISESSSPMTWIGGVFILIVAGAAGFFAYRKLVLKV